MKTGVNRHFQKHPHFPLAVLHWRNRNTGNTPHSHDFLEIVFVAKGTGTHTIDGHDYRISRGDVYVINIGSSHEYSRMRELEYYDILVSPDLFTKRELGQFRKMDGFFELFYLESLFRKEEAFQSRLRLPASTIASTEVLVGEMHNELQFRGNGYEIVCKALLLQFMAGICRSYKDQIKERQQEAVVDGRREALAEVVQHIEKHYAERIDVKKLASLAVLSSSHFHALFQENVGMSPIEFLNHTRVEKAKEKLCHSALNASEIAYRVGFHDPAYFAKVFRRLTGQTPVGFRRKWNHSTLRNSKG